MPFYLTLFLQFKKSVAMTSYTIFWYSLSWFLAFNFWPVNPLLKHFAVTIVRIYLMLLVIASSLANFIFSLFDSSNARPYWSSSLQQHPVACKLGRALNNCLYHFEKCLKDYYSKCKQGKAHKFKKTFVQNLNTKYIRWICDKNSNHFLLITFQLCYTI